MSWALLSCAGVPRVAVAPALGVVPHVDEAALLESTRKIIADPVDVVVVTTGIGFRGWLDTAEAAGLADELCTALGGIRLVARGPKARGALQAAGLRADWVAESETSAEIADFLLAEGVDHQRIAVQRHGAGDDGLNDRLTGGGASVIDLEVYRWGPPPDPDAAARDDRGSRERRRTTPCCSPRRPVRRRGSPSCAGWSGWTTHATSTLAGRLLVAAVGPVTAEPLQVAGFDVVVPERWRMGALVRLVIMELGGRAGRADPGWDAAGPCPRRDPRPPGAVAVALRVRGAAAAGDRAG